MQRLTLAGRLIITALIVAAIFFGFRYFGGNDALRKLAPDQTTESATMPRSEDQTSDAANPPESMASDNGVSSDASATSSSRPAFTFTPPAPQNGQLKGVVELGASGFNSFIVKVGDQKHWNLEKAEFGNSLVMENMATDTDIRRD